MGGPLGPNSAGSGGPGDPRVDAQVRDHQAAVDRLQAERIHQAMADQLRLQMTGINKIRFYSCATAIFYTICSFAHYRSRYASAARFSAQRWISTASSWNDAPR